MPGGGKSEPPLSESSHSSEIITLDLVACALEDEIIIIVKPAIDKHILYLTLGQEKSLVSTMPTIIHLETGAV